MATISVQVENVRAFADAADEITQEYNQRIRLALGRDPEINHVQSYLEGVRDALRFLTGDFIPAEQSILDSVNNRYLEGL